MQEPRIGIIGACVVEIAGNIVMILSEAQPVDGNTVGADVEGVAEERRAGNILTLVT